MYVQGGHVFYKHLLLFVLSDIHLIFGTLLWNTKIQIKFEFCVDPLIFQELWPLDVEKYHEFSVFRTLFVCAFRYSLLLWHIKIQIKFEFGFDPLTFHKFMTLGLRKILQNISFLHFCCLPYGFEVSDNYKSKFSVVMLELILTEVHRL
jgi:hypothetical protein